MKAFDYFLYGVVVFAWSTSWLPLKLQTGIIAPEVSVFWRFGLAAGIMMTIALVRREKLAFDKSAHLRFASLGLFLFSANFTLFYYGALGTSSGLLAVVFSTASFFNLILAGIFLRRPISVPAALAAGMGFIGIALIFWPELAGATSSRASLAFCIAGTLCFCSGNIISATTQRAGISVLSANSWGMVYGACYLGLFSLLRGHDFSVQWDVSYLGSLAWLILISSIIAFTAYLTLLGRIGPAKAGYATVIFPVFALAISTVFENYQWGLLAVLGLALVILGNVLILRVR